MFVTHAVGLEFWDPIDDEDSNSSSGMHSILFYNDKATTLKNLFWYMPPEFSAGV